MNDSSPVSDDLADQTLGEFRLLRRLGRGGMAEVYLAEQTSLSRFVAVKVLREEMVSDKDDVPLKRFEQEARAAGGINHPNIVQVYSIGEENGVHYIVQEYVEGLNLSEHVKRHGPPDFETGLGIMEQVTGALQVAGEAGIVHRDIKPENIMLTRDGTAKVADFGLAQLAQTQEQLNLTQVGTTMGTPLYMSPEQISGQKVDQRSDLYSFGVTSYQMFAGRPPFRGETAMSVAVQHLKEPAPSLQEARPDLPPSVCRLIGKMMNKEPTERFQDAASVLSTLRRIREAVAAGEEAANFSALEIPVIPRTLGQRWTAWSGKRQALAFLVTCLSVAAVAAVIGFVMRPTDPLSAPPAATLENAGSAQRQYALALADPQSESAWKAVVRLYPNSLEGNWARVHLAYLYLLEDRPSDAMTHYQELTRTAEEEFQTQGWAGIAVIQSQDGRYRTSQDTIRAHLDDRAWDRLEGTQIFPDLVRCANRNDRELGDG